MKFAICVKYVPVSDQVEIDPETHSIKRGSAECDINPCDLNAMEMAVGLKKATGATLDVYTMGPDGATAALKKCLALGADEAFLLSDRRFAGGDTLGTAKVLADFLEKNGSYDVIFTGSESSDGATGQVGPMLASLLKMTDVSDAVDVSVDSEGALKVSRKVPAGRLSLRVKTPVVLSVPFGCNEPALPTLRAQMKANRREIHTFTSADATPSVLEDLKVKSVVTDVFPAPKAKKAEEITGTPEEIADQIAALIQERRKKDV
ncbi:MAG: electron transfer flavoprotein subunit beta/FixA family protein [Lachnospiraceae bacterium]|nr:electron transfer flavoprotein subunit beta/FixA family protein [Lachnospiraceae bacterium]